MVEDGDEEAESEAPEHKSEQESEPDVQPESDAEYPELSDPEDRRAKLNERESEDCGAESCSATIRGDCDEGKEENGDGLNLRRCTVT